MSYPGEEKYPHIFSPFKLKGITLRNRIMQSAHAKGFHKKDGITNNRDRYYADKRAEFAARGDDFEGERVRISISDDFLGRPVTR